MPEKLERCVSDLKAKGGVEDPWAVCVDSTGQKPHKEAIREKVNENRQVPYSSPPLKKSPITPQGRKTTKGIGGDKNLIGGTFWKQIFDAQLRRNVKEPRI